MMTVNAMLFGAVSFGIVVCVWGLYCNERTFAQRMKLLAAIGSHALDPRKRERLLQAFAAVPYGHHEWRLMTLRSPWSLYDRELVEAAAS